MGYVNVGVRALRGQKKAIRSNRAEVTGGYIIFLKNVGSRF